MENANREDFYDSLKDVAKNNDYKLSDGTDLSQFLDEEDRNNLDGLFDEEEDGNLKKILYSSIVFLAVGGFSVLAWYAYQFGSRPVDVDQLKLIRADETPYKVKPENPGGMEVPYMDKVVYDSISGKENTPAKVERILPSPEEPVDLKNSRYNAVVEKAKQATSDTRIAKNNIKQDKVKQESHAAATEDTLPKPAVPDKKTNQSITLASNKEVKKLLAPENALTPVSKQDLKPVPVGSKMRNEVVKAPQKMDARYRIQLGAYRSEQVAVTDWKQLQKKFPEDLTKLDYYIERKDLGTKGVFYRLQAGPLESSASARLVCKKLIDKKQGCFFVEAQ